MHDVGDRIVLAEPVEQFGAGVGIVQVGIEPVSYTHLTLPTSDLV